MISFAAYTSVLAENNEQQIAAIQQQIAAIEQRAAQANAALVKQRQVLKQRLASLMKQARTTAATNPSTQQMPLSAINDISPQ